MKKSIILFLFAFSLNSAAQVTGMYEEAEIRKVITAFFDGLQTGDSAVVSNTVHKDIKIQTTYTNKKGEHILKTATRSNLLKNISAKKRTDVYFEKLLSMNISIDGNLASVWTPYAFYINDKFSHCGANSFQLFNDNGKWVIIYLVDMRRRNSCNIYKK